MLPILQFQELWVPLLVNLVFRRDMFVDLPLQADLVLIRDRRQQLIDENLRRQNAKRREFEYQVGQEVLIKSVQPNKLEP